MGQPTPHPGAILILGMLSAWPELFDRAAEACAARFGAVRRRSGDIPFTFTDYYEPQMGRGIMRRFYSFDGLFDPSRLPEAKLWTNELEGRLAGPACCARDPFDRGLKHGMLELEWETQRDREVDWPHNKRIHPFHCQDCVQILDRFSRLDDGQE